MADQTRHGQTVGAGVIPHRIHTPPKIHQRGLPAIAHAVADVIEDDDLITRGGKLGHKCTELRAATTPAMTHDDDRM